MGGNKVKRAEERKALEQIATAIKEIKHGYVETIIQDSKVIQINRTEKIRLDKLERKRTNRV